jgi:Tfp pilus assembly protein PilF
LSPNDVDVLQHLGLIFLETANGEMALGAFERLVELDPNRADAYETLAILYDLAGLGEAALESCRKAMELDPENERTRDTYAEMQKKNAEMAASLEATTPPNAPEAEIPATEEV